MSHVFTILGMEGLVTTNAQTILSGIESNVDCALFEQFQDFRLN